MRSFFILAIALSLSTFPVSAHPGGEGNNTNCNGRGNANSPCVGTPGGNPQGGSATSSSRSNATATATAAAVAVNRNRNTAYGGAGGSASATGGSSSARGGDVTVNNTNGGGGNSTRQVPGFGMGFMMPPQCGVAFNAGGANPQGVGALGFAFETESCRKHRLATALANMGRTDAAISLLCTMSEIRDALAVTATPCPSAAPALVSTVPPLDPAFRPYSGR